MENAPCLESHRKIEQAFDALSAEEVYQKIIEMGRQLPPFPEKYKTEESLVQGCQSLLYLHVALEEGLLKLQAHSDALISAGLSALLVEAYQGQPPEAVIEHPPLFLKKIGLLSALSPSRANGLKSLYTRLQQECLKLTLTRRRNESPSLTESSVE